MYDQAIRFVPERSRGVELTFECTPYRPSSVVHSESDDEDITLSEILPEFDQHELKLSVNVSFNKLNRGYKSAMEIGLNNYVGKEFLRLSEEYMLMALMNTPNCQNFLCMYNTSKGKYQPGAFYIKWSLPEMPLRSSIQNSRVVITRERYADNVVYDCNKGVNIVVSEVKEEVDAA